MTGTGNLAGDGTAWAGQPEGRTGGQPGRCDKQAEDARRGRLPGLRDSRCAADGGKPRPDHSNSKRAIVEEAGAINNPHRMPAGREEDYLQ